MPLSLIIPATIAVWLVLLKATKLQLHDDLPYGGHFTHNCHFCRIHSLTRCTVKFAELDSDSLFAWQFFQLWSEVCSSSCFDLLTIVCCESGFDEMQ
jgi:hypothetical protein